MSTKLLPVPARLSPDVIEALQQICDKRSITISEIIREGIDVYLSGDNSLAGVVNRMEKLENNVFALVESLKSFATRTNSRFDEVLKIEKALFDEASATEKDRIKKAMVYFAERLDDHDVAEKKRFSELTSMRG